MERHKKIVVGPIDVVPCPWCGNKLDCRPVWRDLLDSTSGLDAMIDQTAKADGLTVTRELPVMDCDHCNQPITIVRVDRRPRLLVRQHHG